MESMNGFEIYNKRLKVTMARGPQSASIQNYVQKVQKRQEVHPFHQRHVMPPPPPPAVVAPPPPFVVAPSQHQQYFQVYQPPQMAGAVGPHPQAAGIVPFIPTAQGQMIPVQYITHAPGGVHIAPQPQPQALPHFQHFVHYHGVEAMVSQPSFTLASHNF
jgi:hypothetical protein